MYQIIEAVIQSKRYELNDILKKIDTIWVQGDLTDAQREELVELVEIIQHCSVTGREWAMRYYTALLRRSLSLPNVMDFVTSGEDVEVIAEKLLQAAR